MTPTERAVAARAAQRTGAPVQPHPENVLPIGVQLGIGPNWQPSPAGWRWADLHTDKGQKIHVLILDTIGGSTAVAMSPEDLRCFVTEAQERVSGIVVPEVRLNGKP